MRKTLETCLALLVGSGACVGGRVSASPESPALQAATYLTDSLVAAREVIVFDALRIERFELPTRAGDSMTFRALVTNTSDLPKQLGLELRAIAGQWSPVGSQRAFVFEFAPAERRRIEARYALRRFTSEAALRVSFGRPISQQEQGRKIEDLFFRRWYALGAGNPAAIDLRAGFMEERTAHLTLLAAPGTAAARDLRKIATEREAAVKTIADVLGTNFDGRIRMVFYPDSATKTRAIGHVGMGLAFNRNIVEIYSDSQRLDPFHEVTHIVAEGQGDPPAAFSEGLATYMTERLGADALEHLGHPGVKIRPVACELLRGKRLIPLDSILHYTDIGSTGTYGDISYPEAASFVQFLVEKRGVAQFRDAYRRLVSSNDPAQWRTNESVLRGIYGLSIQELEREWLTSLSCSS
jgi:hypothetical protein